MKKTITFLALSLSLITASHATTFLSGDAITALTAGDAGKIGVYVVSKDGSAFPTSLTDGLSLSDSATYGASFEFINTNTAVDFFGVSLASGGTVTYGGGVDAGDSFGIILFDNSTTDTLAGDTYRIYTDASWILPADTGASLSFGDAFAAVSGGANTGSGSVAAVPEPSTFAALAGFLALGCVALRRRK